MVIKKLSPSHSINLLYLQLVHFINDWVPIILKKSDYIATKPNISVSSKSNKVSEVLKLDRKPCIICHIKYIAYFAWE